MGAVVPGSSNVFARALAMISLSCVGHAAASAVTHRPFWSLPLACRECVPSAWLHISLLIGRSDSSNCGEMSRVEYFWNSEPTRHWARVSSMDLVFSMNSFTVGMSQSGPCLANFLEKRMGSLGLPRSAGFSMTTSPPASWILLAIAMHCHW